MRTYKLANFPDTNSYYVSYIFYGQTYTENFPIVVTRPEYTGDGYSIIFTCG